MSTPRGRPSDPILFRPALPSDAPAIARIHNARGQDVWCPEAVLCRMRKRDPRYPLLVAIVGADGVHGFCGLTTQASGRHLVADVGIDPQTLAGELATRCLVVLWRQAIALGHTTLTTEDLGSGPPSDLTSAWSPTARGFHLDLVEARSELEAAERRLAMRAHTHSCDDGISAGTLPPGFAAA